MRVREWRELDHRLAKLEEQPAYLLEPLIDDVQELFSGEHWYSVQETIEAIEDLEDK